MGESARVRRLLYPVPPWDASTDLELDTVPGDHPDRPGYLLHRTPGGADPSAPTVVYLHGNGSDLATIAPLADLVTGAGLPFAAVEYPGYGPAGAQRTTERSVLDATRRGLAHLAAKGVGADRVVLVGESLGSAVAARMAAEGRGARLVLVSPFTSMTAMYRRVTRVSRWPARLVPDRYETDALAARIAVPTLLVHGADDALVPPAMSARLVEVIGGARRVLVPGRGHDTLWEPPSRLLEEVVGFVRG